MPPIFHKTFESYLQSLIPEMQDWMFSTKTIIANKYPNFEFAMKYGCPFFMHNKKMLFYLWTDKKLNQPYFSFRFGLQLQDKDLVQGDRKFYCVYYCKKEQDLPIKKVFQLIDKSIVLAELEIKK
jgi:hypothetical protein